MNSKTAKTLKKMATRDIQEMNLPATTQREDEVLKLKIRRDYKNKKRLFKNLNHIQKGTLLLPQLRRA